MLRATDEELMIAKNLVDKMFSNNFMMAISEYDGLYLWKRENQTIINEEGLSFHTGATKICICSDNLDKWVIKVSMTKIDYCTIEYNNYLKAITAGVEDFFATTILLEKIENVLVYLQEKTQVDQDCISDRFVSWVRDTKGFTWSDDEIIAEADYLEDDERLEAVFGADLTDELLNFIEESASA